MTEDLGYNPNSNMPHSWGVPGEDVSRETYPLMPPANLPPCDTVAALETLQRELAQVKEALNTLGGMMNMFGEMNAKLYQVLGGVGEAFGELSPMDKIKLVKDLMTNG